MSDAMDTQTGIDWSEWNFDDDRLVPAAIKAIQENAAEVVVRQIVADFQDDKYAAIFFRDGKAKIAFQLIEDSDVWPEIDIGSLDVDRDTVSELDAIIAVLKQLIEQCEANRTEAIEE